MPPTDDGPTAEDPQQQQCLFSIFDRISFYPITEAELDAARSSGSQRDLIRIEDGVLDLAAHEAWEDAHRQDIVATAAQRDRAIKAAPFIEDLIRPRQGPDTTEGGCGLNGAYEEEGGGCDGCERVKAGIPGRCWRILVKEGDQVKGGSVLVSTKDLTHNSFPSNTLLPWFPAHFGVFFLLIHGVCSWTNSRAHKG